nr:formylmethanofuran--tetrahydromethanopterin N-formyltransferase [Candidatus Njordarchaeota archaeon]
MSFLKYGKTEVEDTFAEAFDIWVSRILITAKNEKWALEAANSAIGFATSIIFCPAEAGIEKTVSARETPDNRPGVIIQISHPSKKKLEEQVLERVTQCILTCPTTAVFNALQGGELVFDTGRKTKFFGDGFESKGELAGRTIWYIPVMEGDFAIEENFGAKKGVGGGNMLIFGKTPEAVLEAAEAAIKAIHKVDGVITPFPGGICRSGSKVGSLKYSKFLKASTNHPFCPTLRGKTPDFKLPDDVQSVYEIVMDGVSIESVKSATAAGIKAAASVTGIKRITAANYGGTLGPHKVYLKEVLNV